MKAVVLLSGGQDSTTCLHWAINEYGAHQVCCVSFDYGQRHAKELSQALKIRRLAGVDDDHHMVIDVPVLSVLGDSALTNPATELKADGGRYDEEAPQGLPTSFVPGRNILFLTMAASYAASVGADIIVGGMCQTDYSGYPDCRDSFVKALNEAINLGLGHKVQIVTPLMFKTKAETVEMAKSLGTLCWDHGLAHSLTCYNGEIPGCEDCPACDLRGKGFSEAGYADPATEVNHG